LAAQNHILRFNACLTLILDPWVGVGEGGLTLEQGKGMEKKEWKIRKSRERRRKTQIGK
jgi:hypothetical protein